MISHSRFDSVAYAKSQDQQYYEGKPLDIWWPFWVWRVIAPKEANQSDLFKEIILRLVNTGCKDAETISGLTGLHKDFVLHLIAIMQGGMIMDGWEITERGRRELEDGYEQNAESRTYMVLQDAYSGEVIPRVFENLNYIDSLVFDGTRASYIQSRGSGREVRPFMLRNAPELPDQPDVESVYQAIRGHRKDRRKLRQAGIHSSAVELAEGAVDYLDSVPEAIYMNLRVFVDPSSERSWSVSDPAGLFPSMPILNSVADTRLDEDKSFADCIDRLLGLAISEDPINYEQRNALLEDKVKAELIANYSWASKISLVEEAVLEMLRDHYDLLDGSEKPRWKLKRLSSSLQKVCESIIKVLLKPNEKRDEWKLVRFNNERNMRQQIKAIYLQKSKVVDDELAWDLSSIRYGQIRTAMTTGNHSLRQLIASLVLVSPRLVDELDESYPGWIHAMFKLAKNRNKAGHASTENLDLSSVENDFKFVEKLLEVVEGKLVNG